MSAFTRRSARPSEDDRRQREEDDERADEEVDEAEDEGGEHERPDAVVVDPGDELRRDPESGQVRRPPEQDPHRPNLARK